MFEKKEEGETHPTKRVMIGNVIFIGELYRKKVITHKIAHICLSTLLGSVTRKHSTLLHDTTRHALTVIVFRHCSCRCDCGQEG
jgi:hypothetical protein